METIYILSLIIKIVKKEFSLVFDFDETDIWKVPESTGILQLSGRISEIGNKGDA
jgi:hypothetical protein